MAEASPETFGNLDHLRSFLHSCRLVSLVLQPRAPVLRGSTFWGAGKSTLVQAFCTEDGVFEPSAESGPTVGADFKVRMLKHAGKD